MGEMRIVEIEVIREEEERERDLYFPWLQVHITVPRHHLASSLRAERRGLNESRSIYRVSKYGLQGVQPGSVSIGKIREEEEVKSEGTRFGDL